MRSARNRSGRLLLLACRGNRRLYDFLRKKGYHIGVRDAALWCGINGGLRLRMWRDRAGIVSPSASLVGLLVLHLEKVLSTPPMDLPMEAAVAPGGGLPHKVSIEGAGKDSRGVVACFYQYEWMIADLLEYWGMM